MNIQEFGKTIKAKYPQYADMDDAELGKKMIEKYPQYQDMVKMPLYGNKQEMAQKLVEEKKTGEKAGKATIGGVIKGLPSATAQVLAKPIAQFGASVAETPGTIRRASRTALGLPSAPMTTQKEYSLPLIGKFKSFQSEFEPTYQKAIEEPSALKAYGSVAWKGIAEPVLAGLQTGVAAKGLVGDVALTGKNAGQITKGLIPKAYEQIKEGRYLKSALDITKPKLTLKNKEQLLSEGRVTMKGKITPNKEDLDIAEAVQRAGIKKYAKPDQNIQVIKEEIKNISDNNVLPSLEKVKVKKGVEDLVQQIKEVKPSPSIKFSSEGTKTFDNFKNVYIDEIVANAKDPKTEYLARLKLDNEINNASKGKVWDDNVKALYEGVRKVRQVVNQHIASQLESPDEFLNAMKEEHNLFNGIERIAENSAPKVGLSFWKTKIGKIVAIGTPFVVGAAATKIIKTITQK